MYLAIDGGGTKTEYLLLDERFREKGHFLGGCINHDFLPDGWQGTRREIENGIARLAEQCAGAEERIQDVVVGASGIDTAVDQRMLEQILEDLKIPQYLVCNDGYLPVKASARGGMGVAYNCGTGVCCAGIDRDGRLVNVAGLDEWSDDAGSGRWIVLSMFQKVYASAIRKEQETGLVRTFREEFSAWSKEDILNLYTKFRDPIGYPQEAVQMIALFFGLLEKGDPDAVELAHRMSVCAAENIGYVIEHLNFPANESVQVVLTGSIHTKAAGQRYFEMLEKQIAVPGGRKAELKLSEEKPIRGAAEWLRERHG